MEGVDGVTEMLRTFIDSTNEGNGRWCQLRMDEDGHAICQATDRA